MMFLTLRHRDRYVWDFGHYFDLKTDLFKVFYLNADQILVPFEKHHHAACVGHAITSDFIRMEWLDEKSFDVLDPPQEHGANTSIWSGDVIEIKDGFLQTCICSCLPNLLMIPWVGMVFSPYCSSEITTF